MGLALPIHRQEGSASLNPQLGVPGPCQSTYGLGQKGEEETGDRVLPQPPVPPQSERVGGGTAAPLGTKQPHSTFTIDHM